MKGDKGDTVNMTVSRMTVGCPCWQLAIFECEANGKGISSENHAGRQESLGYEQANTTRTYNTEWSWRLHLGSVI
jgi:hypothetical protein